MKKLKNEGKVVYEDLQEVRCSACNTRMWEQGDNVAKEGKIVCTGCGAVYTFEPVAWKVFLS